MEVKASLVPKTAWQHFHAVGSVEVDPQGLVDVRDVGMAHHTTLVEAAISPLEGHLELLHLGRRPCRLGTALHCHEQGRVTESDASGRRRAHLCPGQPTLSSPKLQ